MSKLTAKLILLLVSPVILGLTRLIMDLDGLWLLFLGSFLQSLWIWGTFELVDIFATEEANDESEYQIEWANKRGDHYRAMLEDSRKENSVARDYYRDQIANMQTQLNIALSTKTKKRVKS